MSNYEDDDAEDTIFEEADIEEDIEDEYEFDTADNKKWLVAGVMVSLIIIVGVVLYFITKSSNFNSLSADFGDKTKTDTTDATGEKPSNTTALPPLPQGRPAPVPPTPQLEGWGPVNWSPPPRGQYVDPYTYASDGSFTIIPPGWTEAAFLQATRPEQPAPSNLPPAPPPPPPGPPPEPDVKFYTQCNFEGTENIANAPFLLDGGTSRAGAVRSFKIQAGRNIKVTLKYAYKKDIALGPLWEWASSDSTMYDATIDCLSDDYDKTLYIQVTK